MPLTSSRTGLPPTEWLQQAADGKLETTGVNVWKALRFPAFIQVLDLDGYVLNQVKRLDRVSKFRVTQRGHDFLDGAKSVSLPFNKNSLPVSVQLWTSAVKRWSRNAPKGLYLTYSEGKLHVLVADTDGKVKNDDAHRLFSVKVPWHEG